MDNGLSPVEVAESDFNKGVLILIVMDNGLSRLEVTTASGTTEVLILIVMDNGLSHTHRRFEIALRRGLNPYCNG